MASELTDVVAYRRKQIDEMTEHELLGYVRACARELGWLVYHTHRSELSEPGFPDLVLVQPPSIIYAELKRQGGRMRPEQRQWMAALVAAGANYYLWYPENWVDGTIERILKEGPQ